METAVSKLLSILPTPVAAVLMLGGVIFYVLGCVRLGYGAAVRPLRAKGLGDEGAESGPE